MNPLIVVETGVLFRYQYMQKQQSWKGIISGVATPKRNNTERRRDTVQQSPTHTLSEGRARSLWKGPRQRLPQ